jgi:hypothetical protein
MMFSVSVLEHLRLNCGLVVQNYTTHARAAERLAALALKTRMTILGLLALATAATVFSLFRPAREYQIVAAVLAVAALAIYVTAIAYGIEAKVHSHRLLAHRLWLLCERYRGLLAEIHDGLVDDAAILQRREALIEQGHWIYEQGFPIDQPAAESLRQPALESGSEPAREPPPDQMMTAARNSG